MIVKSKLRWWYERIRLLPMYTFPSALCAQCRSICASELRTLCCPQTQEITGGFWMLWTFYEGGERRSSCLSKIRFSYRNRKVVVWCSAKAASAAMPRRQKSGEDNPKRRGCALTFWSLEGAGGEIETPPAFLLGDSKGEVLFWKRTSPLCPEQRHRRCHPSRAEHGIFFFNFSKKVKENKKWLTLDRDYWTTIKGQPWWIFGSLIFCFLSFLSSMIWCRISLTPVSTPAISNTAVAAVLPEWRYIRECCAMDMIGTIWDRLCEDHLYIGLTLSVLKE